MNLPLLYGLVGVVLFVGALHPLILCAHLLRKLLALNVMSSGVFLVLAGLGGRAGQVPDPIPHALVITGIVVAVATTALALALLRRVIAATGRAELPRPDSTPAER